MKSISCGRQVGKTEKPLMEAPQSAARERGREREARVARVVIAIAIVISKVN